MTPTMIRDSLKDNPGLALTLFVAALSYLILRRSHNKHSKLPLPPGPRPIPFAGTLQEFPLRPKRLRELHEKYGEHDRTSFPSKLIHALKGDLVYLNAFGMDVIVMGTHEVAMDLFDKRSAIYSDRTPTHVAEM